MASSLVKPLFFAALTGTSGVGGYYGSKLLTSKPKVVREKFSVASLLAKNTTKELLSKGTQGGKDPAWQAAWKAYQDQNSSTLTSGTDPWKMPKTSAGTSQTDAPTEFMDKCDTESKKEVFDDSDPIFVNVSKWCTKEKAKATAQ
ncbi:hypothetical protein MHF_1345 [Mycoplasma haemofelis Ohio2]|uniref:Uncharacterized protein n=1 Tax=Mycoplasma haemofelis (strain Ohio2) TaxID=859194 RepID=F6FG83_MYCHI|nr:hypothetical protein MHF_1345 [Mycoplasma haemofelis Ohio2]